MSDDNEHKGLRGWLILVGIGTVIAPIRILAQSIPIYMPIFQNGTWEAVTTEGSEAYNPIWAPLLIGEITYNLLMVAVGIYLIYLFFSKHYLFPKFFIGIAVASVIFIPLDAWLVTKVLPSEPMFDPDTRMEFIRALIGAAVWIPYMLVSKRVKATFVEKLPNKPMYDL